MKKLILFLFPLLLCAVACKKDENQSQTDQEIILEYIANNNLNAQSTSSGLYYVIENEGTGKRPTEKSDVKVTYKGKLVNGAAFDESVTEGIWLNLGSVITGWQEGIPLFRAGGSGILLIPSELGYGGNAVGSIPSNSVLIFDITLRDVR